MVATLMEHTMILKIDKNLPGDISNIFPYQHCIPSLRNCIPIIFLNGGHPNGLRKFTKTFPEIISPNIAVIVCMVFESIEYKHINFYIYRKNIKILIKIYYLKKLIINIKTQKYKNTKISKYKNIKM